MRVENRVFYKTKSKRSCHVQNCTCMKILAIHPKLDKQHYQAAFLTLNLILSKFVLHRKSENKMRFYCGRYTLTFAIKHRLFYPTISKRSCHVQHSTCNQNVAIHSMFNIQEFQAAFSPLYCTVSKCILHGKSA